ncbi:MAG: prolyl oligopeptidase family protein [Candidatus Heimdallarchaeota archaeon]
MANEDRPVYPHTEQIPVTNTLHGIEITDNYQWLEDTESEAVKNWITNQNIFSKPYLDNIPVREDIRERIQELYEFEQILDVIERENGWFFRKKHVDKQQPVLYFRSKKNPTHDQVLIDINVRDPSGLTTIDYVYPSHDGTLMAYGLSKGGDEWSTLYLMNVTTGQDFGEKESIKRAKYSYVSWKKDKTGFYYTRFFNPGEVPKGEENFHSHIRFHSLGSDPDQDPIIFRHAKEPTAYPDYVLSPDETYMVVYIYRFVSSDLHLIDLANDNHMIPIVTESKWLFYPYVSSEHIYVLSNYRSPNYGVYRFTRSKLNISDWEEVIEPREYVLQDINLVYQNIVALWMHNVSNKLTLHDVDGKEVDRIPIPKNGSIQTSPPGTMLFGSLDAENLFFNFQTFLQPPMTYQYHIPSQTLSRFFEYDIRISSDEFEVTEEYFASKDGTKVHMFIISRPNVERNKKNPTLLYGYGGFGISIAPTYSPNILHWVERNGVIAVANIRGGGEHGEEWHQAGMLGRKQNVFDDFIAAAEYLVKSNICSPETLGMWGGSNGGLLVGAVLVQRPELFAAVYCAVPLLDMLRYHHFLLGKTWVPEYGDPDNPDHFHWLHAYSPYQNVNPKGTYPSVLFKTATNDSRVDASHAFKMAALMQSLSSTSEPILLKVDTSAGHGVGRSLTKLVNDSTDLLTYFYWRLGAQ